MTILVLGTDEHAQHIAQRTGGLLFDTRSFPSMLELSWDERGGGMLKVNGQSIPFAEIGSVYWRSYDGVYAYGEHLALADAIGLFDSFLTIPTKWVNGWEGWQLHRTKPRCLAKVAALGVPVPKTLVTNDVAMSQKFLVNHPKSIVKPVQGGWHTTMAKEHFPEMMCPSPFTIQEFIRGTNIRVFVAGLDAVACEIVTDAIDFRDDPNAKVAVHTLPPLIARRAKWIAKELSLLWTGIDFRLTPEGEYVFLEANPSPMFLEFERETGLPLTEMLVNLLKE